eukprot:jgi/Picre1/27033/NNA_000003.t1
MSFIVNIDIRFFFSRLAETTLDGETGWFANSFSTAAVKRKMQCLIHIIKECLADLFPHPVALLYLADSSAAIHYEEEFDYDPAIKRGIHLAACTYTDEVYNCLRRSSTL